MIAAFATWTADDGTAWATTWNGERVVAGPVGTETVIPANDTAILLARAAAVAETFASLRRQAHALVLSPVYVAVGEAVRLKARHGSLDVGSRHVVASTGFRKVEISGSDQLRSVQRGVKLIGVDGSVAWVPLEKLRLDVEPRTDESIHAQAVAESWTGSWAVPFGVERAVNFARPRLQVLRSQTGTLRETPD